MDTEYDDHIDEKQQVPSIVDFDTFALLLILSTLNKYRKLHH